MHTSSSSPEVGRARGAHSPSYGENQILTHPTLSDYSISGNSRLVIGGQPGSEIREEFTVSSRFVLRAADQRWCFDTLWEAVCQQQRLTTELAAKEGESHAS
jgi:hypothetical protein